MGKKRSYALAGAGALAAIVVVLVGVIFLWPRRPAEDCSFSSLQRSVGIDLEAQVGDLDVVKGKLAIADSQVREYDALLRDYALKYDTACRDVSAKRIGSDEYACLRQNMTAALEKVRQFTQAVEASKGLSDPAAQKEIAHRLLDDLLGDKAAATRASCSSAMVVTPHRLAFAGQVPERSIQISNQGNRDIDYAVDGWPDGFHPSPVSGRLARGATATVSFIRTVLPVPAGPLGFHVRSNFQDDVLVELAVAPENLVVWKTLGEEVRHKATESGAPVDLDTALAAVDRSLAGATHVPRSDRYLLAASVLYTMKEDVLARAALDQATPPAPAYPSLGPDGGDFERHLSGQRPEVTLTLSGLLAQRRGDRPAADTYFKDVTRVSKLRATARDLCARSRPGCTARLQELVIPR